MLKLCWSQNDDEANDEPAVDDVVAHSHHVACIVVEKTWRHSKVLASSDGSTVVILWVPVSTSKVLRLLVLK